MSFEQRPDTDAEMHKALSAYLPKEEPPIGLRVEHIMGLGRRRARLRRVVPVAAAAVVTALIIAVGLGVGGQDAEPDRLPMGGDSSTTGAPETGTTTSVAPTSAPGRQGSATASVGTAVTDAESGTAEAGPDFRVPAGHVRGADADALAKSVVGRQPAANIAAYFGTQSAAPAGDGRHGFGFHLLWQDGGRYGYLAMLHRTKGDFPASVYGMPAEPCLTDATRLPAYHCTPVAVPAGGVAYSFEIDNGYRIRGVVWDQKDPGGNGDIRITGAFYVPEPGAWTPFAALDSAPPVAAIPLSTQDLADMIGI